MQNYPEEGYEAILKNGAKMDVGNYVMISGTRLGNGGVLAQLNFFNIEAGKTTETELVIRQSQTDVQVIGNFNSENKYYDLATKSGKSLLSTTGRGFYVLGLINPTHEPSNHALHDIEQLVDDYNKWGQKVMLLFADEENANRFKGAEFKKLPETVVFGTDINGTIAAEIKQALNLTSNERPIFIIADTFNRIVFVSQGYTIGLGEQMINVIHRLEQK